MGPAAFDVIQQRDRQLHRDIDVGKAGQGVLGRLLGDALGVDGEQRVDRCQAVFPPHWVRQRHGDDHVQLAVGVLPQHPLKVPIKPRHVPGLLIQLPEKLKLRHVLDAHVPTPSLKALPSYHSAAVSVRRAADGKGEKAWRVAELEGGRAPRRNSSHVPGGTPSPWVSPSNEPTTRRRPMTGTGCWSTGCGRGASPRKKPAWTNGSRSSHRPTSSASGFTKTCRTGTSSGSATWPNSPGTKRRCGGWPTSPRPAN